MKKLLAITFLVIIIGNIVFLGYFFLFRKGKIEDLLPDPFITGAEKYFSRPDPLLDKKGELINLMPVNGRGFEMSYSLESGKFAVSFSKEVENPRTEFTNWLKSKGFDMLPQTNFIFQ